MQATNVLLWQSISPAPHPTWYKQHPCKTEQSLCQGTWATVVCGVFTTRIFTCPYQFSWSLVNYTAKKHTDMLVCIIELAAGIAQVFIE